MRAGKAGFLLVLTGLCVALVACGQQPVAGDMTDSGNPGLSRTEPDRRDAAIVWANEYCDAVGALVDGLATLPAVDPTTPQRAVQTSADLLAAMITSLERAVQGLEKLPPSPVAGGETVRADEIARFTAIRDRAATAKQTLDDVREAAKIDQRTVGAAREPLDEIANLDLLSGFNTIPDLLAASHRAPVCQRLTSRPPSQ